METQERPWTNNALPVNPTAGKNRIYDALVQSETNRSSENLFDISERMVQREKDNSKKALEELWILKKTCHEKDLKILDQLIDYYQKKVDSVRQKEERLKNISTESGKLLDEKKKIQQELAALSQEIEDCVQEINFLKAKQDKLQVKQREIKEKNDQLQGQLGNHEREVMDSLQSVILARADDRPVAILNSEAETPLAQPKTVLVPSAVAAPAVVPAPDTLSAPVDSKPGDKAEGVYKSYKQAEHSRFPKSIVKTDKGRILGEYFYDPKVYKNARSYVFNGHYFVDQIKKGLDLYKMDDSNAGILNDITVMASDILNRTETRRNILFEVSTNEILNKAALTEMLENLKSRNIQALENFCGRYFKKIDMLGQNHELILAEQLSNLGTSTPAAPDAA